MDLLKVTEKLMNILYASEWKSVTGVHTEDYLFAKIKTMHMKILKDNGIETYEKGASALFDIANRLTAIEIAITGNIKTINDVVTIRKCIDRTNKIIYELSGDVNRYFCIIS